MNESGSSSVRTESTTIPVTGQEFDMTTYLARPDDDASYPTLVVIHEAFGLDPHIQDITRRLANEGYVAIAPDLFSLDAFGRTVKPEELLELMSLRFSLPAERRGDPAAVQEAIDVLPEEKAERFREISAWNSKRDPAALVSPLTSTVEWARERSDTTDGVGVTGFCFGGGMTLRLAFAGTRLDAAVPFYGANPPLEQASQVQCPLLLMYGRRDPFIIPGLPALFGALIEAELDFGARIYENTGHAFLNDARPEMYSAQDAPIAWGETIRFLGAHLH